MRTFWWAKEPRIYKANMADMVVNEEKEAKEPQNRKRIRGYDREYQSKLTEEDRNRYLSKRKVKNGEKTEILPDPYKLPQKCWRSDPTQWPSISHGDLYSYLIESPGPFDKGNMKSYKSLKAFDYFTSRKVGEVFSSVPLKDVDAILLKAEVRPGQAESSDSLNPWIIAHKNGKIHSAHCDCMAGIGEVCSHMAAVLFKVETAVRTGLTQSSCTSESCRWNRIFGNNSLTAPVTEINFKCSKRSEVQPRPAIQLTGESRHPLSYSTDDVSDYLDAYKGYFEQLKEINPNACLFTAIPKVDCEETDTAESDGENTDGTEEGDDGPFEMIASSIPSNEERLNVDFPELPLNCERLPAWTTLPNDSSDDALYYISSLNLTYDQMRDIECKTREQNQSDLWYHERKLRLTSSNFGLIIEKVTKTRSKPKSLAQKLINPPAKSPFIEKILKWGVDNEEVAVQVYQSINKHIKIFKCGLIISPEDPYLAASPDRIVYDTSAQTPWGLVEVKCPWNARNLAPTQAARTIKNFYLQLKTQNGGDCETLALNTDKFTKGWYYYMQMQGQMALSGASWCDFVVYTTKGIFIDRIQFDCTAWKEHAQILRNFAHEYFIPVALQQ